MAHTGLPSVLQGMGHAGQEQLACVHVGSPGSHSPPAFLVVLLCSSGNMLALFCPVPFHSIPFYSLLLYFVLFYSILFYFNLFHSILYSILFYSILFYSILLYFIQFYSVLIFIFFCICTPRYMVLHMCKIPNSNHRAYTLRLRRSPLMRCPESVTCGPTTM